MKKIEEQFGHPYGVMSKREYIATKAMQGFLSNPSITINTGLYGDILRASYEYADGLLALGDTEFEEA